MIGEPLGSHQEWTPSTAYLRQSLQEYAATLKVEYMRGGEQDVPAGDQPYVSQIPYQKKKKGGGQGEICQRQPTYSSKIK